MLKRNKHIVQNGEKICHVIWITTTKYQKYLEQNMNYYITSQQTIYKSWYLQTKLRLMQSSVIVTLKNKMILILPPLCHQLLSWTLRTSKHSCWIFR